MQVLLSSRDRPGTFRRRHAEAVHQRIGGVAEDQQVKGVAQVAVVVDPVGDDGGLVGGEVGHGFGFRS